MIAVRLAHLLERESVPHQRIRHPRDVTAQETAEDTHTPGRAFAKTVVLESGEGCAFAVLPATHRLDLAKARAAVDAGDVHLADEQRMAALCPDCALGAEPPFGNLYDVPVYVDRLLTEDEEITFNAGSHEEAIRMRYRDFARLVHPRVADLVDSR